MFAVSGSRRIGANRELASRVQQVNAITMGRRDVAEPMRNARSRRVLQAKLHHASPDQAVLLCCKKDIEDLAVDIVSPHRDQVTSVSEVVAILVCVLRQFVSQKDAFDADFSKRAQPFRLCNAIVICINPYTQAGPYCVPRVDHTVVVAAVGSRIVDFQSCKSVR